MTNDSNIKNFTAVDIEKYHKGLLSAKEMHDLEKAALDDPFLADALEGYAVSNVNAAADIAELKKRLLQRTSDEKVIPITSTKAGSRFPFLRVAVMILLIAGAGFLVYQLAFSSKSKDIAQAPVQKQEAITADTNHLTVPSSSEETISSLTQTENKEQKNKVADTKNLTDKSVVTKQNAGAGAVRKDTVNFGAGLLESTSKQDQISSAPVRTDNVKSQENNSNIEGYKKELAKEQRAKMPNANKSGFISDSIKYKEGDVVVNGYGAINQRQANQNFSTNTFRGRITDNNNNPVPFANITNTRDNVGTYSDARGNFNLTSPDSVLDVQVRSLGFENNNVQLRNNLSNNLVVLQNDLQVLNEVVVSNKKTNAAARSRDANMKLEEPEPADGWDNYDIYLANNLNVPDEIKTKKSGGEVEVSFEVDKNGEPVNLKVEKSLCNKCDQEAIRLIKDGPKWKRKTKKGRTTVTIPF